MSSSMSRAISDGAGFAVRRYGKASSPLTGHSCLLAHFADVYAYESAISSIDNQWEY
jgi:hypothetical protein